MRFHHFEDESGEGVLLDLDKIEALSEDTLVREYKGASTLVYTIGHHCFLVRGDYREIADLVMAKAPVSQAMVDAHLAAGGKLTIRWQSEEGPMDIRTFLSPEEHRHHQHMVHLRRLERTVAGSAFWVCFLLAIIILMMVWQ